GAAAGTATGRPDTLPADLDDQPRCHSRTHAAGAGNGTRGADAAAAGHHGNRRSDRQYAFHAPGDPAGLPRPRTNKKPDALGSGDDCPNGRESPEPLANWRLTCVMSV